MTAPVAPRTAVEPSTAPAGRGADGARLGGPRSAYAPLMTDTQDGTAGTTTATTDELGEVMGRIARTIQQEHGDVEGTLQAITNAARDAVPGADSVSISLAVGRRVEARAATDELPREIDDLQTRMGEGPCLDALRDHTTVRVEDFAHELRWPRFAAAAREHGVGSSISFQLFVDRDDLGALNVYSRQPHAFGAEAEVVGTILASHASIALSAAQQERNLRLAVDARDLIGQAKGILMERHRLTAAQAFQVLVRTSSLTNRKLVALAAELTETGSLPAA